MHNALGPAYVRIEYSVNKDNNPELHNPIHSKIFYYTNGVITKHIITDYKSRIELTCDYDAVTGLSHLQSKRKI